MSSASPAGCRPHHCHGEPVVAARFDVHLIPEVSGVAASSRNPGVLWLLDDGPGATGVWALDGGGSRLAFVEVAGLAGVDTEGLAVSTCDGSATCVYVGDIGNNARSRPSVRIHRFPEPDLANGMPARVEADTVALRYPGPPEDAEALLVSGGVPYLVTKAPQPSGDDSTAPPRLLGAEAFADGVLRDLGAVPLPEPSTSLLTAVTGNVVTGGDTRDAPSGGVERVLLRTYDHAVEYVAPNGGAALSDIAGWHAQELPSPWLAQPEAVAYAGDGCGYYTASEGVGSVWFIPCRD